MALQGTLADFGIAEILQLIGTQQKTGILFVERTGPGEEVQVYFSNGRVIRCDVARRDKRDLLGNMLLAAEVINKDDLAEALRIQKKTLRRVGDILVERGNLTPEVMQEFTDLQTRETLYKLFEWKTGKYRFEGKPPNYAKPVATPISSESLLLEGFRMLDEWPLIRTKVNNYDVVYKRLKTIEEAESDAEALERILDDAFSEFIDEAPAPAAEARRKSGSTGSPKNLGKAERRIFGLADGKRNVQRIIERSRLGEFETCKALVLLLNEGYITARKARPPREQRDRGDAFTRLRGLATKFALNGALLALIVAAVVFMPRSRAEIRDNTRQVAAEAMRRLRATRVLAVGAALEVYQIEDGSYPDDLGALVEQGLIEESVIRPPGQPPLSYLSIGSDYDLR